MSRSRYNSSFSPVLSLSTSGSIQTVREEDLPQLSDMVSLF